MKASAEQLKESKKLEMLFNQSKVGVFGGCLITTLAVILFWGLVSRIFLCVWLSTYFLLSYRRYRIASGGYSVTPQGHNITGALFQYTLLTFLGGCSWGVMSVYILHQDIPAAEMLIIFLVGGLTASSAIVYSIYPGVFVSFAFPAFIPLSIFLLMQEESLRNIYGGMVFVFLITVTVSVFRLRRLLLDSIGIQFENIQLLDDIENEKMQVSDLNTQLQEDLKELRRRDVQLREEKGKAEKLAEKLLILSTLDGLTGIANRRHFDEYLAKEWNRSVRSSSYLSLILCDIDHFKPYNDHYGHQKGDHCLQQISGILEHYTRREGDLAARYGGEEFAIILPETTQDNANIIAEKIRSAIENAAIPHHATNVSNIVTVSMGVCTTKPDQTTFSASLIAEADRLLYKAKAEGRNRIVADEIFPQQVRDTT